MSWKAAIAAVTKRSSLRDMTPPNCYELRSLYSKYVVFDMSSKQLYTGVSFSGISCHTKSMKREIETAKKMNVSRCEWGESSPLMQVYHDTEWGFPATDDCHLFEKICLEGFQAGLSWRTILEKRENFRSGFADFDFNKVAAFTNADVERLIMDAGIVRHRGKIMSTINNAKCALELKAEHGSLAAFFWQYQGWNMSPMDVSTTAQSIALAKALKQRGWTFVGPTTMYAFMQSMGLVNDHTETCCVRAEVIKAQQEFVVPG